MSYYNNSLSFCNTIKMRQSKDQPLDSVQIIVLDPYRTNEQGFLAAGWDGIIRYYRIPPKNNEEIQLAYQKFLQHPIISVCFGKDTFVFAGLATGQIVALDMANDKKGIIGKHDSPICKLFWIDKFGLLLSLGFDCKLKFWNMQNSGGNFLAKQFDLPSKVHTAAYDYPYLLIGTADNKIAIINVNSLPNLIIPDLNGWYDIIQMGSKFQCSAIHANSKLYAFGCVDGRCCISTFEDSNYGPKPQSDSTKKMMSKSMKKQSSYQHSPVYGQVNDIDIGLQGNQQYLVITGSEEISFFNVLKKDKPKRIKCKGTAGKLSYDGKYFIYAEGNDWSEGMNDFKKNTKPKIQAIKFTKSEMDGFVSK